MTRHRARRPGITVLVAAIAATTLGSLGGSAPDGVAATDAPCTGAAITAALRSQQVVVDFWCVNAWAAAVRAPRVAAGQPVGGAASFTSSVLERKGSRWHVVAAWRGRGTRRDLARVPAAARGAIGLTSRGGRPVLQHPTFTRYVVLGDSYSSGEANPPFDPQTDQPTDQCHRSAASWPRMLGAAAGLDLACSGATVASLFAGQTGPPDDSGQVVRLRAANAEQPVDLVTMTLGGNDIGFSLLIAECFVAVCLLDPAAASARVDAVAADLAARAYPAVLAAAPGARVVVVGYPRLFPTSPSDVVGCTWLSDGERVRANDLAAHLDGALAAAANAAGVEYVSVLNVLDHHELCTTDSWVNPIRLTQCNPLASGTERLACGHPIAAGQRAIADVVRAQVDRFACTPSALLAAASTKEGSAFDGPPDPAHYLASFACSGTLALAIVGQRASGSGPATSEALFREGANGWEEVLRSAPILRAGDLAAAGIPSEKVASLRAAVAGTS